MSATAGPTSDPTTDEPPRSTYWISLVAAGVLGSAVLLGFWKLRSLRYEPAAKDVAEPIMMIDGGMFEDGGSQFVSFRDAAGVTRSICLLNEIHGRTDLLEYDGREVALSGADARAIRDMLERWLSQDPDAQTYIAANSRAAFVVESATMEELAKWYAVQILHDLQNRNER